MRNPKFDASIRLVAEAAVVGRSDDLTGEAVCAFVVLKRAKGEEIKQDVSTLENPAIPEQLKQST